MRWYDAISISILSLFKSPVRSLLTLTSYIIGILAPCFVFSISEGMSIQIQNLGSENFRRKISIYQSNNEYSLFSPNLDDLSILSNSNIDYMYIGGTQVFTNVLISSNNENYRATIHGITEEALPSLAQSILYGQGLTYAEPTALRHQCLINQALANRISTPDLPLRIYIGRFECQIIGIVGAEPYVPNTNNIVYLDINVARDYLYQTYEDNRSGDGIFQSNVDYNDITRLSILFESYSVLVESVDEIIMAINQNRLGTEDQLSLDNLYYAEFDAQQYIDAKNSLDKFLILVMVVVSSFVIINTSLNSYYTINEKKEEIAVQIAIGANSYNMILLVAIETTILILIAGTIGMALSFFIISHFRTIGSIELAINIITLMQSFAFLSIIGLFSSVVPCWTTSKINPADAIKR